MIVETLSLLFWYHVTNFIIHYFFGFPDIDDESMPKETKESFISENMDESEAFFDAIVAFFMDWLVIYALYTGGLPIPPLFL